MAEEPSVNFVDYDAIQAKFPDIHILFIRDVYLDCLNQTGYFINDISLINLVLHTAIAIDRIRNDYADVRSCQDQPWISAHVYQIAEKAGKQFE